MAVLCPRSSANLLSVGTINILPVCGGERLSPILLGAVNKQDLLWSFEQSYIEKGVRSPLEGSSWSWLLKIARVSFLTVADIKLELVECQLPYSDFSDASLTVRAACHEFRYDMGWRQFHYWLNCKVYTDDNLEFHPWPKKDSKILLEVERISKTGTKYRRRGLWNMASLADHTYMWNVRDDNPGYSLRRL